MEHRNPIRCAEVLRVRSQVTGISFPREAIPVTWSKGQ